MATRDALGDRKPALLTVFCSVAYDLEALLAAIRGEAGPGVPIIGCSTAGEIATDGPGSAGVVVAALGGDGFTVKTACATDVSDRLRDAGAEVAHALDGIDRPHRVLMLLTDGLAGDQQEIVRGAYSVAGAGVPLVGGCAGDDLGMTQTHQLFDDRVLTNAVVAVAIGSEAPMGIGVRHGWRRIGEPMVVTHSRGNRVYRLDDEPALDVYLRRLGAPAEAAAGGQAFTRFALTHPLGLSRRSGEEVRYVGDADLSDRSLGCIAGVPQGGLVWLMEGDAESVMHGARSACVDALAMLDGRPPVGLLAFDCIARRGVLGEDGIWPEVAAISQYAGGAPVAGFYTYGEIARTRGTGGFHNQTLVVLALG